MLLHQALISTSKFPPGSQILAFTVTAGVSGSQTGWKNSMFDGETFGSASPSLPEFSLSDQAWGLVSTDTTLEFYVGTDGGASRLLFEFIHLSGVVYMEADATYSAPDQSRRKWVWNIPSRVIANTQVVDVSIYK